MSPRVSVLMQIWNAEPDVLRAAVESVLAQTVRDFELLVFEDPSPRLATELLASFGDPRITHRVHERKTSLGAARNRGLRATACDLVAIHDADDVSAPERLERQLARLEAQPELAVLGTQLEILDAGGARIGGRLYPTTHEAIVEAMPRFNPIAQPSVMLRKSVVLEHGGYDEDDARICEDYELWSRLARKGVRFGNLGEALVRYRLHDASIKSRKLRATLRDTIAIKQLHWASAMSMRGRARLLGERALLGLPPSFVHWLFRRTTLQS